jgi:hypothetical protein
VDDEHSGSEVVEIFLNWTFLIVLCYAVFRVSGYLEKSKFYFNILLR